MPKLYRALHDLNGAMDASTGQRPYYRAGSTITEKQIKDAGIDGGLDRLLNKPGSDFYKPGFSPAVAPIAGDEDVTAPEVQQAATLTASPTPASVPAAGVADAQAAADKAAADKKSE